MFGCEVGLSDHTLGIGAAVASVALEATVIEKHFTLKRADGGVDSAFSMEPSEFSSLVNETKSAWESLGAIQTEPTEQEISSLQFRRSVYVVKDMKKGETFTRENLRSIRPGNGLPPKMLESTIGNVASRDIRRGTPLSLELIH